MSTAKLQADERKAYTATDLLRLDNRKTHICCSIEFPNAWYFDRARGADPIFHDWVVLMISPEKIWNDDTLFCPRNAAAEGGRLVGRGVTAFESLFAQTVQGKSRLFHRTAAQLASTPTDEQAEVLVRDRIPREAIVGVAVRTEEQARTERTRLRINGDDPNSFEFVVAPHFYEKYDLSAIIRRGERPDEPAFSARAIANV